MLEIKNLTKNYNSNFSALYNVSFKTDIRPTVIIGKEGAGKTTLLNILAGVEKDFDGDVFVNDFNRRDLKNENAKISYITKEPTLFLNKSVYYNLEYVFKVDDDKYDKLIVQNEIKRVCEGLEIFDILNKRAKKCSLFEQRLICLARAILKKSNVLLVDEPFFGLLNFECAQLWQAMVLWIGKLSGDLIVAENGENMAYFDGCNVVMLDAGVKI